VRSNGILYRAQNLYIKSNTGHLSSTSIQYPQRFARIKVTIQLVLSKSHTRSRKMHLSTLVSFALAIQGIRSHSIAQRQTQPPFCGALPGKLCNSNTELDCCSDAYNLMHCLPCSESDGECNGSLAYWEQLSCTSCIFNFTAPGSWVCDGPLDGANGHT
jgi:hypothetical protein